MTSDEWRHASPRDVTSRELDKADMPGDLLGGACNGHVPDIDALSIYFRLKLESGGTNAKHLSLIKAVTANMILGCALAKIPPPIALTALATMLLGADRKKHKGIRNRSTFNRALKYCAANPDGPDKALIKAICVSKRTYFSWKKLPEFQESVADLRRAIEAGGKLVPGGTDHYRLTKKVQQDF